MLQQTIPYSIDDFVIPSRTRESFRLNLAQVLPALIWLVFPCTIAFAITRQSLWIDEGSTVWIASHDTFQSFFRTLVGSGSVPGDPQFIFYLLHIWGWIKLFGSSELSLRAANIPFAVIFIFTMSWASRRLFWHSNLWALFCLSPFFWFYLNEARPYIALLAFSSIASVALLAYLTDPVRYGKSAPWFCLIALFLAWGAHILAIFLFPALLVIIARTLAADSKLRSEVRLHWLRPTLWCAPAFVALGTFYGRISANGVSKVDAKPGLANLAFALYEFSGFAGLGPPRNDIRQNPHISVFLPYWPWLLLGALALAAVAFCIMRSNPAKLAQNVLLGLAVGLAVALAISLAEDFQFLGRHLTAFLPLLLISAMFSPRSASISAKHSRRTQMAFLALGGVWAISDLRLVLMAKYEKDSYREACSLAIEQAQIDGAKILWVADPLTARYYGLQLTSANRDSREVDAINKIDWPVLGRGVDARNWRADEAQTYLHSSTSPVILVVSKPETSDPNAAWRVLIDRHKFTPLAQFNAFAVFEWRPDRNPS